MNLLVAQGWTLVDGQLMWPDRELEDENDRKKWFGGGTLEKKICEGQKRGNGNVDVSLLEWLGGNSGPLESVN